MTITAAEELRQVLDGLRIRLGHRFHRLRRFIRRPADIRRGCRWFRQHDLLDEAIGLVDGSVALLQAGRLCEAALDLAQAAAKMDSAEQAAQAARRPAPSLQLRRDPWYARASA